MFHQVVGVYMDYEQFASDLPRQRTFVFASVEENEETMRRLGVNQQVRQLGPGEFHCDMVVREHEQATLFVDRFNKACSLYLEPPANSVGLLVFRSAGGRWLASGNSVANDKLVVLPRGSGTDLVAPDLMGSEAITIPESRFIELNEALCPAFVRPERMAVIEGNTAQLHALRKAVVDLVAEPESHAIEERLSNLLALWITWMYF